MFREMRLKENELSHDEAKEILMNNSNGVLALSGDNGYSYAVPVSFAYSDNKIYFHGATEGHKPDSIKRNDKVSFCVIEKDEVIAAEFNTHYRSAIAFGVVRILESDEERLNALRVILEKYSPDFIETGKKYIENEWNNVAVFEINIEHLTAKQGL